MVARQPDSLSSRDQLASHTGPSLPSSGTRSRHWSLAALADLQLVRDALTPLPLALAVSRRPVIGRRVLGPPHVTVSPHFPGPPTASPPLPPPAPAARENPMESPPHTPFLLAEGGPGGGRCGGPPRLVIGRGAAAPPPAAPRPRRCRAGRWL